MKGESDNKVSPPLPRSALIAFALGFAGLLPQVVALFAVISPNPEWHFAALCLGYAYAALIMSFLGGMWWGIAAQFSADTPRWLWFASVVPMLAALLSAVPWALGYTWPGPSLQFLGFVILLSLLVDLRLRAAGLGPAWWLGLRFPLSLGLGGATIALALFA